LQRQYVDERRQRRHRLALQLRRLDGPADGRCDGRRRRWHDMMPDLIPRVESVPFSRWHLRPRLIVGSATFFDAFDALSLAFVLPVLVRLWHITPAEIGWLIAIGYLGQFVGALLFGSLAERYGRIPSVAGATALMSFMS